MPRLNLFDDDEMAKLDRPLEDPLGTPPFLPSRIISGGQTGVDRAGLDVAIDLGIEHGGWCPRGRLAEDGPLSTKYCLVEMDSPHYPPRTRKNVQESDATLILYAERVGDGTRLTQRACQQNRRPCLMMDMTEATVGIIQAWLKRYRPETLNIAGTRESISPGIHKRARALLMELFAATS